MHVAAIFVMQICHFTKEKNTEYNSLPQRILVVVVNHVIMQNAILGSVDCRAHHVNDELFPSSSRPRAFWVMER